jgi:hypothetical protein
MISIQQITRINLLKSLGRKPRVHPNGFIQFDIIPGELRMNVWPERLIEGHPGRIHPIHNHSFDLHSVVMVGALTNVTYSLRQERWMTPTHVLHQARRVNAHDSVLEPIHSGAGALKVLKIETIHAGQDYALPRLWLHDSLPHGLTMTLMWTENPDSVYAPHIAVPVGVQPMNDYRRDAFDEDMLWDIIETALEKYEYQRKAHQTSV